MIHYFTARLDIKNSGKFKNQIEFLFISDENHKLFFPDWFRHDDGIGAVIESYKGDLDLKIRCIHDGTLSLRLRGIHAMNSNKVIPIFINFTQVIINGTMLINEEKLVSHDDFYSCNYKVKDGDILFIHVEWKPFKIN